MYRIPSSCLLAAAIALVCSGLPFETSAATAAEAPASQVAARTSSEVQDPYLVVQDTWIYMIDESGVYLDRARDELARKMSKAAAGDVRKAAALVQAEATRAYGDDGARLRQDVGVLMKVADEIDSGKLVNARNFELAVATAQFDLGVHHDLKAAEAWARGDTQAAGRSLAAAGRYVGGAMRAVDEKIPATVHSGLLQVEGLGERVADGTEKVAEADWARARSTVGQAIETLGKKLESRRAS